MGYSTHLSDAAAAAGRVLVVVVCVHHLKHDEDGRKAANARTIVAVLQSVHERL